MTGVPLATHIYLSYKCLSICSINQSVSQSYQSVYILIYQSICLSITSVLLMITTKQLRVVRYFSNSGITSS